VQFVAAARSYVGVPWKHQGRSRTGLDCIGLTVLAGRDCGLSVPLTATYGRQQAYWQLKPGLVEWCKRIGTPEPGAIVLYKDAIQLHVAVWTEAGTVVQSLARARRVVESGINFTPLQVWMYRWERVGEA